MKTLLLALTMFCCTAWLAAQTGPAGSGNTSPDQTSPSSQTSPSDQTGSQTDSGSSQTAGSSQGMDNSNETTIQGCLTSSGGNFMLTNASGVQYQLQGDTSKLQSHANQEVQVKGTSSSASGSASASAGNGSMSGSASNQGMGTQGTGTATTAGTFTVSKVKKISGTCTSSK